MDTGLQCKRGDPELRRRIGPNTELSPWEELHQNLDSEQRIVLPETYLENRKLYDDILGTIYIIGNYDHPNDPPEWCWDGMYWQMLLLRPSLYILSKALLVRLRLPWNAVNQEWLVDEQELAERQGDYDVLDTFIHVVGKDTPSERPFLVNTGEFEANRELYIVCSIRYLVGWAISKRSKLRLLSLNPERNHQRVISI